MANNNPTHIVTGEVRLSYVNIFKARSFVQGQDEKYSVCVLIDKNDTATLNKIMAAVEAAKKQGVADKWGGKMPANLKMPLRDGDDERAMEAEEYEGKYFLNANSKDKPGIVDANLNEILDSTEVYSGCYGRVSLNFYPFNSNGNKGIAVGLNNVQKLRDGEPLGGVRASAEDDFADSRLDLQGGQPDYSSLLG